MRRFLTISIPIVTILLFIFIMQSVRFLKKPIGKDDDFNQIIIDLREEVDNENWDEVNKGIDDLNMAWMTLVSRIQFSVERDEINNMSNSIARLKGSAKANDKSNSMIELYETYNIWTNLDK